MTVHDTGLGGGSIFEIDWSPPAYDALGNYFAPLKYGRVEIDLGNGQPLVDGVIIGVGEAREIESDDGEEITTDTKVKFYRLRIATKANLSKIDLNEIAIRVLS